MAIGLEYAVAGGPRFNDFIQFQFIHSLNLLRLFYIPLTCMTQVKWLLLLDEKSRKTNHNDNTSRECKRIQSYSMYWYNQPSDSQYVYIGRFMPNQIPINSKWRNPFPINKKTPDQEKERRRVLIEFKEYLTNQPMLSKQIPELKDKVLGCWCKPLPCHGDVLAELADKY